MGLIFNKSRFDYWSSGSSSTEQKNSIENVYHGRKLRPSFRTGFIAPSSRVFGRGELVNDHGVIMKRNLSSYFIIDVLSVVPLPQVAVLFIIPKLRMSDPFVAKDLLTYMIVIQYVPRLLRIYPLLEEVKRTSVILTETEWAGAAFNLFLYMLASHVVGAFWYLFSVESELRCWHGALRNTEYNDNGYLSCRNQNANVTSLLTNSCVLLLILLKPPTQQPSISEYLPTLYNLVWLNQKQFSWAEPCDKYLCWGDNLCYLHCYLRISPVLVSYWKHANISAIYNC